MPAEPRWAYYTPRAWATIGGTTTDVVKLQIDYELSAIPRCTLFLPVGRQAANPAVPAVIHQIVAGLTEQMPVQVWLSMSPQNTSDDAIAGLGIPPGSFKIFDGYTAGGGYIRATSAAQYMIAVNGYLVRMNQASALSDSSQPSNPAHYSYGSLMLDGSDLGTLDWHSLTLASTFINSDNLALDVWGDAFFPWLQNLTRQDGIQVEEAQIHGDGTNGQAAAALATLAPGGRCYVPLKFNHVMDGDLALAASQSIAGETYTPGDVSFVANQTLWDLLIGKFAAEFAFAVVPRVSDSIVVPYIPGYRGKDGAWGDILAGEYTHIEINTAMPRPLRAMGILSAITTRTGSTTPAPPDSELGIGGFYDTEKEGAVMFDQAPRWLSSYLSPGQYSDVASGGNVKGPIGNAINPGEGQKPNVDVNGNAAKLKRLLDDLAKCRYAQEILRGRYAAVSGPLRFDIAPGSLVRVEGASEAFIAPDGLGQSYYGQALRVSIMVDAETPSAGVAFHLGHVRTEAENQDDRTSVASHPLYTQTFLGCSLVDP